MYTFKIEDNFLSESELMRFEKSLSINHLDKNVWPIFKSLFNSRVPGSAAKLLKIYENSKLCAFVILIKCNHYGRALFNNKILARFINFFSVPFFLWMRVGCCMDMMSNPGFIENADKMEQLNFKIIEILKKNFFLSIIYNYTNNSSLYHNAAILPALPQALIDTSEMENIGVYIDRFKNLKRKVKIFKNKGGTIELYFGKLDENEIPALKKCFLSTAEKSIFYLPYQDLYLNAAINTSNTDIDQTVYFVVRLNGKFIGYQAAIKTGSFLNALHGAFDRELKTTFHAYENLILKMTEYAIENHLSIVDFGAVLNTTKQRMVNTTKEMSYFLFSKYRIVQFLFKKFLKATKIQGSEQLKYTDSN